MKVTGVVKDAKSGESLPGASVYTADINGKPLGGGVLADTSGNFTLDSKAFDDPTNMIGFSYAGYKEYLFIPSGTAAYTIKLEPTGGTGMDAVFVTAKKKAPAPPPPVKKSPWLAIGIIAGALGVGGAVWFFLRKKKH